MQHPVTYVKSKWSEGLDPCPLIDTTEALQTPHNDGRKEFHLIQPCAPFMSGALLTGAGHRYLKDTSPQAFNKQGIRIRSNVLFFDIDLKQQEKPEATTWAGLSPGTQERYTEDALSYARNVARHAFYPTNGGYRLVFFLDDYIEIGLNGAGYWTILQDLAMLFQKETGTGADTTCMEWYKLFRLPYPCSTTSFGPIDQPTAAWLLEDIKDANEIAERQLEHHKKSDYPINIPSELPTTFAQASTHEDVEAALDFLGSDWQERLKGDLSSYDEHREQRCLKVSFALAKDLSGTPHFEENIIFALLAPAVEAFGHDESAGAPYLSALPRKINTAMALATRDGQTPASRAILKLMEDYKPGPDKPLPEPTEEATFLKNLRLSFPNDILDSFNLMDALGWVAKNKFLLLFDSTDQSFHWLQQNGFYPKYGTPFIALQTYVNQSGFPGLFDFWSKEGKRKQAQHLIEEYAHVFKKSEYAFGFGAPPGDAHVKASQGFRAIELAACNFERRTDITGLNSEVTDTFLRSFVPPEDHERMIVTFGAQWYPELGPTAHIILNGPPGCGKTMMALVQSHQFKPASNVPASVLVADRNGQFLDGPIITASESLPASTKDYDLATRVRELTDDKDTIEVNPKYGRMTKMPGGFHRLIITVNQADKLLALRAHGDLSDWSIEAIAQRTQYFQPLQQAADYLSSNGGASFTKGWVTEPPYLLIRQIMYDLDRYLPPDPITGLRSWPKGRLKLVSGNNDQRLIRILGGASEDLLEKIMHAAVILADTPEANKHLEHKPRSYIDSDTKMFRVASGELHDILRIEYPDIRWSPVKTGKLLAQYFEPYRTNNQRYYCIPIKRISDYACENGIKIEGEMKGFIAETITEEAP